MDNEITPSQAAAALGRIKSEKKAAAGRENVAKARAIRQTQLSACTCGADGDDHVYPCPVYMRQKKQESRSRQNVSK